jgi:hypothetical protein
MIHAIIGYPVQLLRTILGRGDAPCPTIRHARPDGWKITLRGPMATATEKQALEAVIMDADGFVKAFEGKRTSGSWPADRDQRIALLQAIANGSHHSGFLNSFRFGGEEFDWRRNRFDPVDHRLPAADRSSPAYLSSIAWAFEDEAPAAEPKLADLVRDGADGGPLSCKVHALFHTDDPVLRAVARARPWIVRSRSQLGRILELGRAPSAQDVADMMSAYDYGRWPTDARTILQFDAMQKTKAMMHDPIVYLSLLAHLPPEWVAAHPGGPQGLADLCPMFRVLLPEGISGARNLLNGCKGRLDLFLPVALGTKEGMDADTKVGEIGDFIEFLSDRLVVPLAGTALHSDSSLLDIPRVVAKRLATPDGNLRRLREKSDLWHADVTAFNGRGHGSDMSWPVILPCYEAGSGISIVGLASASDLRDEGDAMVHCVATYDGRCAVGRSFVFSVRRRAKGGGIERLSTVELVRSGTDGSLEMTQHLGIRNTRPHADATRAVEKWMARIASGKLASDQKALASFDGIRLTEQFDIERASRDIDPAVYAGIILPAYAAMSVQDFAATVRAMVAVARDEAKAAADPTMPRAGWNRRYRR